MTRRSKEQKDKKSVSRLQACCAVAGCVVLLGAVAVLASAAFSKPSPPDLTITRDDIRPSAGGWVVDIVVANHGDLAAAAVDIEGRFGDERSGVSLDYVPGRGEKKASLVFSGAQKSEPRLRVLGWSEP